MKAKLIAAIVDDDAVYAQAAGAAPADRFEVTLYVRTAWALTLYV